MIYIPFLEFTKKIKSQSTFSVADKKRAESVLLKPYNKVKKSTYDDEKTFVISAFVLPLAGSARQ